MLPTSLRTAVLCLGAVAAAASPALAQDTASVANGERRVIEAARPDDGERIMLDGRLDEEVWRLMALVNNVQFATASRVMGWQARFRWIVRPGNDLYVVYVHYVAGHIMTLMCQRSLSGVPIGRPPFVSIAPRNQGT